MSLLLAVLVALVHTGLAPLIDVAGVHPNLVLVAVVIATSLSGFLPGLGWAFIAGLTANLFAADPLGTVPLGLLVAAALVAGAARLLVRLPWAYPVLAVLGGSLAVDTVTLGLDALVGGPGPAPGFAPTLDLMLRAALLNAAIAAVVLFPARALVARSAPRQGLAW